MRNAPEKHMYLESWPLVGGVVREDYRALRRWSLVEEVHHSGWGLSHF